MRRTLLFGLLGPWLACLLAIAALSIASPGKSIFDETPSMVFATFFGGYGIALLPLVPAGVVDGVLAGQGRAGSRWRIVAAGLTAFAIIVWMAYSIAVDHSREGFLPSTLFLGLAAGLPAALCSWLAARTA